MTPPIPRHSNSPSSFIFLLIFMLVGLPSNLIAQHKEIREEEPIAHVEEMVTVRAVVANVHTSRAGIALINFERHHPNQTFTAVDSRLTDFCFSNFRNKYFCGKESEYAATSTPGSSTPDSASIRTTIAIN